jgi:hypothetical protein
MSEYFLVVGGRDEGKTEFLRDCLHHDIEGAELEATIEFERLRGDNPDMMVRVINSITRRIERAVDRSNIVHLKRLRTIGPTKDDDRLYDGTDTYLITRGIRIVAVHTH